MRLELRKIVSSNSLLTILTVFSILWLVANLNGFSVLLSVSCAFLWMNYFTTKQAVTNLEVERFPNRTRAFTNEDVIVTHKLRNNSGSLKVTVLSQIEVAELLSYNLLEREVTLKKSQTVTIQAKTSFSTRGKKLLTDFVVVYEHPLGFFKHWAYYCADQEILVLPKIMHLESFPSRLRELLPGSKSDFKLLEDTTQVKGVREYSSEPLNRVHWKISAKLGSLYVKEFDFTAISNTILYLDLNLSKEIFAKNVWAQIRKNYEEEAVLAASSIIYWLTRFGNLVDIVVIAKDVLKTNYTPKSDWVSAVELLAMAKGDENGPQLNEELAKDLHRLTPSNTLVIVSMYLTDSLLPLLISAKAKCSRVIVLLIPYGYRDPRYKPSKTYEMYPIDMQRLLDRAKLLEREQIIVRIVKPSQTLQEVFDEIQSP
ncbi:MAG: DUF58 domain-containing protein [Pseudothermotoga sp.]